MAGKMSAPGHGGGKRGRLDVTADPNVIPFIDVMLVLLIIFMIAAPIASVDVEIDLPTSKIIPSKRPPKPTWVSLQENSGQQYVFVMNDQVNMDGLGEAVFNAVNVNSPTLNGDEFEILDQRIYVRADSGTRYKNVMRVMNRLQDRGFTKIALVAEDRRR